MGFEIAGYQVRDRLHEGPQLSVYRALRSTDGLQLVVKVPNSNQPDVALADRLHNEFRILQKLEHERICRPHALEPYGPGVALFSIWLEGSTLGEHIAGQPLSVNEFLRVALQMTEAVAYVHESEVIHRDLNPSNFIVDPQTGEITLIDFDLATLVPREPAEISSPGALEGTLAYISPEQTGRTNRTVDYRSDFYSLGATFYEMLTGVTPFVSADRLSLVHQHIAQQPAAPSDKQPGLPKVIDDIVLKLLAKSPEQRYQSAAGLVVDLQRCRDKQSDDGQLEWFEIAESDFSQRFQIPERLYGRDQEVSTLVHAFRRTADEQTPKLMLVSGEPGIGKSSLVNEVQTPIVEKAGYFVTGKFDQFKRNVPFASLIEALRDLVRQVLTEPEAQLRLHQERVRDALGANAQLLLPAIPELERLTGPLEAVPELAALESQNRFRQVFRNFIKAFAQPGHPLCILLDDVQWIDSATLQWIESTILDRSLGPLLLICAYRDTEVSASHPFVISLDRMRERQAAVEEVTLGSLPATVVRQIVADTLHRDEASVEALADLLHAKTGGNPFFLLQLLGALYRDGAIRFDSSSGAWSYDLEEIRAAEITDNVVEYLTNRLQLLPEAAQEILRLAACVGNSFDLNLLSVASESTADELRESLQEPLEQGLIVRLGQRSGEHLVRYRFQHDRVQQAAYRMMDESEARQVRLRIGRRMLADSESPETDDRLFDILLHLNFARTLIGGHDERIELAKLNLAAAARARTSTAYEPALELVKVGMDVVPDGEPKRLLFDLALERAECEHLNGDDDQAEAFFTRALAAANDDFERGEVYERKIHFYTNRALFERAYETGQAAARMFGIWLPKRFIPPLLIWDHLKIIRRIRKRDPVELVDLPELQDDRMRLAMKFMGAVAKAAYQIRPELCVSICARIVDLSLRHGYTPETAIGYIAYGIIYRGGVRGDHQAGYEFGRLVLDLVERFDNQSQRAEVTFVYGYFANSWIRGLADSEEVFRRAYQAGIDSGDFFHASCAGSAIVQNMLMRGADLDSVWSESERFGEFVARVQTHENVGTIQAVQQTIRNLRAQTTDPGSFSDEAFDEEAYVDTLGDYGSPHLAHYYFVDKLLTLLLWEQHDRALAVSRESARYLKESPGMQHAAEHHFLTALLHARLADSAPWRHRLRHIQAVHRSVRAHRKWAGDSPDTYLHKQQLLDAELHRISRRHRLAAQLYDEAIEAAERQGYQNTKAMAHELAGRFHLERASPRTARYHLTEAAQGYHRWGATGVATELTRRHPTLLGGLVFGEVLSGDTSTSSKRDAGSLDLETVLKSTEAISSEVQLAGLLQRLMTIARENAGAERGVLLRALDGELVVQAEVSSDGDVKVLDQAADTGAWAQSIVNFVVRTGESLVLADASTEARFRDDPHVASTNPRSVLCAPLYYLSDLFGVIYLENNLAPDAFTDERIEMINLLSGQISISIANAELYEQLEEKVRLRTVQLEARNRFIRQTFGRYLSDEIVDGLLEAPEGTALMGEKRKVTVIVSDLRGFTPLAEDLRPEDVVSLINIYLGVMTEVLAAHDGTIIDFVGDSVVAVFGAPFSHDDDAARAVACAIEMQRAMVRVNELNAEAGYPPIGMGIALDTGEVVVGSIGSEKRAKYTVLGSHVNLAARIETYSVQGDVLISQNTRDAAGPLLEIAEEVLVQPKGFHEPINVSYVRGIGGSYDIRLPERESLLTKLPTPLAISYVDIDGKHVSTQEVKARVFAISESEAEIQSASIPEPLTNLRIALPGGGDESLQAYAKVMSDRSGVAEDCFRVTFTSLPNRTRTGILDLLGAITV